MGDLSVNSTEVSPNLSQFGYDQLLKRVLGLGALIFYGLAYICPFAVFSTYGIMAKMSHGMLTLAYGITTIAMFLTALSYRYMVKSYPIAGSAYSYVQRAVHPHIGFISGWAILMDYLLTPMINFLVAGLFLQPIFPNIPAWFWIIFYIVLCTIINIIGIKLASWVNNVLIILQLIFIVAITLFLAKWLMTGNGAATFFDWNAIYNASEFNKDLIGWPAIFTTCSVLAMNFFGFDAVTTVVEETKKTEKTVGRAIIITCLGAGAGFVLIAYLAQLAWPAGWYSFKSVDTGSTELIGRVAGSAMVYIFTAIYCTGLFAAAIACQASAARILFGMGRDSVLPKKIFAYVHPKFKTPVIDIIIIGLLGLSAVVINLEQASSFVSFGALFGFTFVNISVICHYFIRHKKRSGWETVKYLIVPILGAIINLAIWVSLSSDAKILGFTWMALGIIYLAATTNFFRKLPPDLKMED